MAYVEDSGEVGDNDLQYWGCVQAPIHNVGAISMRNPQAMDTDDPNFDVPLGVLDYGMATIRNVEGSTVASISRAGEVSGHTGSRCGVLEGFTFQNLRTAAQYMMLVDPDFLKQ